MGYLINLIRGIQYRMSFVRWSPRGEEPACCRAFQRGSSASSTDRGGSGTGIQSAVLTERSRAAHLRDNEVQLKIVPTNACNLINPDACFQGIRICCPMYRPLALRQRLPR